MSLTEVLLRTHICAYNQHAELHFPEQKQKWLYFLQ